MAATAQRGSSVRPGGSGYHRGAEGRTPKGGETLPGLKRWAAPVAIVAGSALLLAVIETSLMYIQTLLGESRNQFLWTFRRILIPWGELACLIPLVVLLARKVPLAGRRPILAGLLHAGAAFLFGATHLFLDVLVWRLVGDRSAPMLRLTAGLISRYMLQDVFLYWTVVGGLQVYWQQRAARRRELAQARLAAELAEARLAALQPRLEPHFLFNTLNTAVMLVRGDRREQAVDVLLELSELLRAVIRGAPDHQVPLEQEWGFVRRYLALEQARFETGLSVELHQDPGLDRQLVPFLILQPLVENALRHGVAQRSAPGPGHVEVIARCEGELVRLEVHDNGPGIGQREPRSDPPRGVGIANVRARLRELYGDRGGLAIKAGPEGGTIATVTLPRGSVRQ